MIDDSSNTFSILFDFICKYMGKDGINPHIIYDEKFDLLFNNNAWKISNTLKKKYNATKEKKQSLDIDEDVLIFNFKKVVECVFNGYNLEKKEIILRIINKLSNKEFANFVNDCNFDFSQYYSELFKERLEDKNFVVEILKKCNKGPEHDCTLIRNFKSYFYKDSKSLRELIFNHPQIYDKLAKAGNKPNFSPDYLKKLVYTYGPKYFVDRLGNELKNDSEFMRNIIIETPQNLFRGFSSEYEKEIRKNAFSLFGDNSDSIFKIYGFDYILSHSDKKFMDFYEYIKVHGCTDKEILKNIDKFLEPEEIKILLLRGKLESSYQTKNNFPFTKDFTKLLRSNFDVLGFEYNEELIQNIYKKYNLILENKKIYSNESNIMSFVNNIALSYKNNTINEFDELLKIENGTLGKMVDMGKLNNDVISKIGITNIEKMLYYPNSFYILSQIINDGSVGLYSELLKNKHNSNLAPAVDINVLLYSTYMHKEAIIDLKNKGNLNSENIRKLINITKNNKLLPIEKSDDVINYSKNLIKFCDENIKNCEDVSYAKELLFARTLKTNRRNAQDLIIKYKYGLKEKNAYYYELFNLLEFVDSLTDVEAIKNLYNKINKLKVFSSNNLDDIEEKIKKEIIGEQYIKCKELSSGGGYEQVVKKFAEKHGVKAMTLDPKSDFEMLIHVFGAYGSIPKGQSIYEMWNTEQRSNVSGICTSLISNNTLQSALSSTDYRGIVFGFMNKLPSEEILMCAPYDIYSKNAKLVPDSYRTQSFHDSKDLPNYSRGAIGCKYNEIVISRYHEEQKRQPDCIILFGNSHSAGDEFINNVIQASKDFNIPIVIIDEREVLKEKQEQLNRDYDNFVQNPTLESAKKLFTEFETIKNGFGGIKGINEFFERNYDFYKKLRDKLNQEEAEKFYQFRITEEKKNKTLNYNDDQEELVENYVSEERTNKIYKELRKKYGILEANRLLKIKNSLNVIKHDEEIVKGVEGRAR